MDPVRLPIDRRLRWAISAFIVWHAAVILFTNTQAPVPPRLTELLQPYGRLTRLMQRWALFCPEPRRSAQSYVFEIAYADGRQRRWQRPLPPKWGFFERQHAYDWQKFDTASDHMEDERLWADIAAWAGREFDDPSSPIVSIRLLRSAADIPAPSEEWPLEGSPGRLIFRERPVFSFDPRSGRFL